MRAAEAQRDDSGSDATGRAQYSRIRAGRSAGPAGGYPGRLRRSLGLLKAVTDDLVGTISKAQCKQLYGTMKDFEMRLVPKLTPMSQNVIMTAEEAKELLECARWKCRDCIEDGDSCRQCKLYQLLEATTPMEDYGTGMICPYSAAEWE